MKFMSKIKVKRKRCGIQQAANLRKAGPMKDRRKHRENEQKRKMILEQE
jgi:hypothetical protein